jgi:FkbM family methyltransferase
MKKKIALSPNGALSFLRGKFRRRPNWLVEKYGPKLYSQNDEELIIRDFFQDKRGGFFVDVGSNHHRIDSTTCYLEEHLGWQGIAIDALCGLEAGYRENRKDTRFFCYFVSDRSDADVDFYVTRQKHHRRSSADGKWAKRYDLPRKAKVRTITLDDLLAGEGVRRIDLLSMDIELAEPAALAGFEIEKYHPALVCIELHKEIRQAVHGYFTNHGYGVLEKYEELDRVNSYFAPLHREEVEAGNIVDSR